MLKATLSDSRLHAAYRDLGPTACKQTVANQPRPKAKKAAAGVDRKQETMAQLLLTQIYIALSEDKARRLCAPCISLNIHLVV